MSGSSTTIMPPPLNMMISTLLTSSSSDLATLAARSRSSSQIVKDDGAELFEKNVHMTVNPQRQLVDIITEVLDLVSDEEDHLWEDNHVLVERSNQEKLKDDPWSS